MRNRQTPVFLFSLYKCPTSGSRRIFFTGLSPLKKQVSGWRHEDCRRMCLASYSWILPVLAVAFVDLLAIWWLIKQLQSREPYASVIESGTRQKLRFFRFVLTDRRVPLVVKLIPSPVAAFLANPIDLIPDFLPVVGYLDDVGIVIDGLALIVKMIPFELVSELIGRAKTESA